MTESLRVNPWQSAMAYLTALEKTSHLVSGSFPSQWCFQKYSLGANTGISNYSALQHTNSMMRKDQCQMLIG